MREGRLGGGEGVEGGKGVVRRMEEGGSDVIGDVSSSCDEGGVFVFVLATLR